MRYPASHGDAEHLKEQYRRMSPIERMYSNHGSTFSEKCGDCRQLDRGKVRSGVRHSAEDWYCRAYADEHGKKESWIRDHAACGKWEKR